MNTAKQHRDYANVNLRTREQEVGTNKRGGMFFVLFVLFACLCGCLFAGLCVCVARSVAKSWHVAR